MKLFMFLAIPLSLVYTVTKSDEDALPYSSALTGLILGAFYAFIECMFTSAYYLMRYAFFPNYVFYLFFEVVLPCLFCTAVRIFFSKERDTVLPALYFVIAGFYAVYMPARIMHRNTQFDWYLLFVKPLLYIFMLGGVKHMLSFLYGMVDFLPFSSIPTEKSAVKRLARPLLILAAVLCIPPAIDVMNLLNLPFWTVLPAFCVYCVFAVSAKKISYALMRR